MVASILLLFVAVVYSKLLNFKIYFDESNLINLRDTLALQVMKYCIIYDVMVKNTQIIYTRINFAFGDSLLNLVGNDSF